MAQLIFGRHPVLEALKSGASLDKVMLQEGTRGEFEIALRRLCKENGVPMQVVPRERLDGLLRGANHQGVAAFQAAVEFQSLDPLLASIFERGEAPLIVLLDGVTDVRNAGAIARTAEGLGAHALVVPQRGAAQFNPETMKTSAGALNWLPVCREKSLHIAMDIIRSYDIKVLAADAGQGGKSLMGEVDLRGPVAMLFGAEGEGIHPSLLKMADERFYIPMSGHIDSFNVSVAAGMALYEAVRQRKG